MKSKYFPLLVGFVVVFGGAVYLHNPGGQHGLAQGFSAAAGYLPRFIIALVIAVAAGHVFGLLSGKKRREKTFANGSLIVFLLIAALLIFKSGWVQDQLDAGQRQVTGWMNGSQHQEASTPDHASRPSHHPSQGTQQHRQDQPRPTQKPAAGPDLEKWASQVNHQLPHKLDKYTQLSRVSYVAKSNTVFIRYDVDSFDSLGIDEDEFVNRMRSNNQKEYCRGDFLKDPRVARAHINIQYHYHFGGTIGEPIRLAPGSC